MRRIYIATSRSNVLAAQLAARDIRCAGHYVVSRWHERPEELTAREHDLSDQRRTEIAMANHSDLTRANTTILLAHPDCRGALVELGLAFAMGQDVLVVGDYRSISLMTALQRVGLYGSLDQVEWLTGSV